MVGLGLLQDPEFDPFEVAQVLIVGAYAQGFLSGAQSCCMRCVNSFLSLKQFGSSSIKSHHGPAKSAV